MRLVPGRALLIAVARTAAGLVAAAFLVRVLASLLYGVTATDPFTFAAVPLLRRNRASRMCAAAAVVDEYPVVGVKHQPSFSVG